MKEVKYKVKFNYYQYNSGLADNGTYSHSEYFDDLVDAIEFSNKVDRAHEDHHNEEWVTEDAKWGQNLVFDISYGGFLNSESKIYEVITKEIDMLTVRKEKLKKLEEI